MRTENTVVNKTAAWYVAEYNRLAARARELGSTTYRDRASKFHDSGQADRVLAQMRSSVAALEASTRQAAPSEITSSKEQKETAVSKKTSIKENGNGNGNGARPGRTAAGKPCKKVEDFRQVRPGTARESVLRAMAQGLTVEKAASKAGVSRTQLLAHAHCLWRDCGIGYKVDPETKVIEAVLPGRKTIDDAVAARAAA